MSIHFSISADTVEEVRDVIAAITGVRPMPLVGDELTVQLETDVVTPEQAFTPKPQTQEILDIVNEPETPVGEGLELPPMGEKTGVTPVPGAELDLDGVPWDARIHSGGKTKLTSGHWKKKRGVGSESIAAITAELQKAYGTTPATEAATTTQVPTGSTIDNFGALVTAITAAGITDDIVAAAVGKQGVVSLPLLATQPELIPAVAEELGL